MPRLQRLVELLLHSLRHLLLHLLQNGLDHLRNLLLDSLIQLLAASRLVGSAVADQYKRDRVVAIADMIRQIPVPTRASR